MLTFGLIVKKGMGDAYRQDNFGEDMIPNLLKKLSRP